jgi:hypothetical protein
LPPLVIVQSENDTGSASISIKMMTIRVHLAGYSPSLFHARCFLRYAIKSLLFVMPLAHDDSSDFSCQTA